MYYRKNNLIPLIHKNLSYSIVGCLFEVYNTLGYGYKEKIYEKALIKLFDNKNIEFQNQIPYKLYIKNEYIGIFYFDFLIENKIILEIKQGNYFTRKNIAQVKNYLIVSNLKLALLANFTPSGKKFIRILNPNNIS